MTRSAAEPALTSTVTSAVTREPRPVAEGVVPYPPEAAERYRAAGYWTGQTFADLLDGAVARHGDRTAVVGTGPSGEQRWTYAELDARARGLAAGLAEQGVAPGDRVVVWLPNVPEYVEVVFALFRLGALPVFALPAHRASEIRYFAEHAEARAIVTVGRHDRFDHAAAAAQIAAGVPTVRHVVVAASADTELPGGALTLSSLRRTPPDTLPGDDADPASVAFLQLSGGTTGLPKLIPRTHDDYLYSVRASAEICGLSPATVYLAALPASHNFTMSSPGLLGVVHAGGTTVLAPSPDPDTCFRLIEAERVTLAAVVPPLAAAWVQAAERTPRDLSSLEVLQVGGAKCAPELARKIPPALGARLQQVFGMAEGLVNYTRLDDPEDVVRETQGRPISPDDEIRVVDPDDAGEREVAPGEVGALLTRGPYTIRGYYRADEHNASAFTEDGFYRTGDLVRITDHGDVVVSGRVKEQINRGGEKIAAEEVENHLLAHPDVVDAAVVGVPDDFLGERTHAFVVPVPEREAPTPAALRRFVRDRGVAAYKVPDTVEVVEAFPVTGVGKTSRRALRTALAEHLTAEGNP
ncbi:MAG: 2,3-dihydroxybenzoate-AMP ligase of siderophore biosynthesis [uncultured Actinomycetospora sp.]|uniref:2,3-dihydroxybenzoate-AMP ligase of siderophore biosynthesis n=1 Tax=uncultured Actinomycetospora sp. TaxID=1135996 RepID=A0A6J4K7H6_9PSEU|nr:MAG: 2,3-dihydroxybenzoate-AMP ligase of siderophore biosynthesis [uncultured Actinomycetospora sp.]